LHAKKKQQTIDEFKVYNDLDNSQVHFKWRLFIHNKKSKHYFYRKRV